MENPSLPTPDMQNPTAPDGHAAQTNTAPASGTIPNSNTMAGSVTHHGKAEEKQPEESPLILFMKSHFSWFAGTACLYALLYTFCLYDNPAGITFPVITAATILFSVLWIRKAGLSVKRGLIFYFTGMMLLGTSTCLTANSWFHFSIPQASRSYSARQCCISFMRTGAGAFLYI